MNGFHEVLFSLEKIIQHNAISLFMSLFSLLGFSGSNFRVLLFKERDRKWTLNKSYKFLISILGILLH